MDQMNDRLNSLLAAYRQACPDPEVSPDFMPRLWQRIEARRSDTAIVFRRLAQACAVAALAVTLLIGTVVIPRIQAEFTDSATYMDALSAEHSTDFAEVVPGGDLL